MVPEEAVVASILLCLGGSAATAPVARARTAAAWATLLVVAASSALLAVAVGTVLLRGASPEPIAFLQLRGLGVLRFHVDGLSSVFLALTALVALPAALYSVGWVRSGARHGAGPYHPCLLLLLGAMVALVTTTDTMWFFFGFWQLLALPGWWLVRCGVGEAETARAARAYLAWMEVGCAAAMLGAALLGGAADPAAGAPGLSYDFATLADLAPLLVDERPVLAALAFGLFLVGFGIKMGMWPFGQLWLPQTYSAAPPAVSAILCGVMSKSGVYGLVRCFLWLVPAGAEHRGFTARWGCAVAVLGTVTLFVGTMQALRQHDAKRLLAFHSIGQIGYILLGAGACMALLGSGDRGALPLAAAGLFGALLHGVNHALFKGLLFLDAGSIERATGTRDLDRVGGLVRYMPLTALTAMVGSFAISGVPLCNGFVSKWAIYVSAVLGQPAARYLAVCAVVAIVTSALTLASFIKFFGAGFLSRASALVAERAASAPRLEVPWTMQLPQLLLAAACLLLGIAPSVAVPLFLRVLEGIPGDLATALTGPSSVAAGPWAGVALAAPGAAFAPVAVLALLAVALLVAHVISRMGGGARRRAEPWLCGYAREADCFRYPAHSFYGEVKRHFRWLGAAPDADGRPRQAGDH